MLVTIKLLYIKSPSFTRLVAVKVITLVRHLQNPPPSPYFMSVCMSAHTHATLRLWRSIDNVTWS